MSHALFRDWPQSIRVAAVLVSVAALVLYQQKLDTPALLGMGLIVSGVVVIQLFSTSSGH